MDVKEMTARCGLACFACAIYKDNITEEEPSRLLQCWGWRRKMFPVKDAEVREAALFHLHSLEKKGV